MADKKTEGPKPEAEAKTLPKEGAPETKSASDGGLKAWLPLIVTILIMPLLAFATTKFLIIPKVVQARSIAAEESGDEAATEAKGDPKEGKEGKEAKETKEPADGKKGKEAKDSKGQLKKKQSVQISKVIVNVAGSMGTRYLMTTFTLAGTQADFKSLIDENKDQLLDLANTALASKTINDLEKPGARNQIRAELLSVFNNALGGNVVQEIYFTEFAIQ